MLDLRSFKLDKHDDHATHQSTIVFGPRAALTELEGVVGYPTQELAEQEQNNADETHEPESFLHLGNETDPTVCHGL